MEKKIKKYIPFIIITLFISFAAIIMIIFTKSYNNFFSEIYSNDDAHYNLITFNSVIAGFLFSGLSILVSLISNDSVKRLWDNGYLDCFYISNGVSILSSLFSIIFAFIILNANCIEDLARILIIVEYITTIYSLILFMYCTLMLLKSLKILRRK